MKKNLRLYAAILLLALTFLIAAVSLFWTPYDLDDTSGGRLEGPSLTHIFGTDRLGRDLASYVMVGTRIAYMVGFTATIIAALIGVLIGLLVAWLPQWADSASSSFLDTLIAFPTLLLAMLIGATQGRSVWTAIISIGIACSAVIARLTRILTKQVMSKWFFISAKTSGTGSIASTFIHILPNIWQVLSVNIAVIFGVSILAEAGLSYLGLGVPPPNASLGRLMQNAQSTVLTAPLGAIVPGLAIIAIVIGVNLLADAIRDKYGAGGGIAQ
ncbi:ABC transporter permease [Leadbettera azotonutricia]|uniref:ABC transporter, permease protein n=1 Tax=Leadbettera azotonutricia (strain ATCC BAA-888 / DSM 13862 / ZAS-9) TaxID=545695 RepID=F5YA49_LEAAZ|nr:ABC transporter permease [Leadbettera azotonutricia]AEF82760.1 ABC transporter, permease protein [Leadbettera azotonutricia ZAS-9]